MVETNHLYFCPLVSGSSGNSTYVACGQTKVLIDCGRSGAHLERCLREIGVDIRSINHILLTHAHTDHVQSAALLSRRFDIPIHATIGCWKEVTKKGKARGVAPRNMRIFRISEQLLPLDLGDLQASFFPIPHDAAEPVGYRLTNGRVAVAVATDIGSVSPEIKRSLQGASVVLLEANHDVEMLQNGPYTPALKKRILSDIGHLSNENAGHLASQLFRSGTKRIFLGHLSKENNRPEIAYRTVVRVLKEELISLADPPPRRESVQGEETSQNACLVQERTEWTYLRDEPEIFMTMRDSPSRLTIL